MHPRRLPVRVLAENSLALLREVTPYRGIRRGPAQHLEAPEELDALVQRQRRGRGRPVVARHAIVAEKSLHLGQVPEEMRVSLEGSRALECLERGAIVAARLIRMAGPAARGGAGPGRSPRADAPR